MDKFDNKALYRAEVELQKKVKILQNSIIAADQENTELRQSLNNLLADKLAMMV